LLKAWTGVYVGAQIGYAWGTGNFNDTGFDPITRTFISGTLANNPNGVIGGAHLGYQFQFDQSVLGINPLVLGIEGSVDGTSLTNTAMVTFPVAFQGGTLTAQTSADVQGSIRGKIGIAWDRLLIYGTGGVAFGGFSTDFVLVDTRFPIFATANTSSTRVGWTAGGGIQYAVVNNWWVFAEYRFTDFGSIRDILFGLPAGAFFNGSRPCRLIWHSGCRSCYVKQYASFVSNRPTRRAYCDTRLSAYAVCNCRISLPPFAKLLRLYG
jgi:outer membrane immunogenic protein